jgi:prepilin-type N-terminal cleavage/methylation domain-containing protein
MLRLGSLCHFQNWDQPDDHEKKKPILALGLNVKNQAGFTLIEIIAVLVILSVVGAITFTKAEALSESATLSIIEDAIRELNSREMVTWANIKLSDQGWIDDATVFATVDVNLGSAFHWGPRADTSGGKLHFKDVAVTLTREPSQNTFAGRWRIPI